ncbi:MAG TPA: DUF4129 domain-containing protein [bacterium]
MNTSPRGFVFLRAALPAGLVAIELCWLYPWLLLFTGAFYGADIPPLLSGGSAFALLAMGFLTVRFVLARPWSLAAARTAVVAVGLTSGLTAVKLTYYPQHAAWDLRWLPILIRTAHDALPVIVPAVMASLLAALLWWRGIVLGEREFTHFEIERAFRRGVGWTIVFMIFFAIYGDARGFAAAAGAPAYLLGFFSLGLVMLAVTRLLAIWQESQTDEAQALAANRHWLLLLVGVVGVILTGATLFSGIVHVQFRPAILRILAPLAPVVEFVFLVAFSIALVIARAILYVLSHFPRRYNPADRPPESGRPLEELLRELPPAVVTTARWGMVALVVGLLILLIAIAVVRSRRRAKKPGEDERESVWSTPLLLAGLGQAWRNLWARLRAARSESEAESVGAMRAIYRELLRIGAGLGIARRPSETPYEYRPRLSTRLPDGSQDIASLTEAYVRVRYTREAPSNAEVAAAHEALARVRGSAEVLP